MSNSMLSPEIAAVVGELPIFDQWTDTTLNVQQAVAAHPTEGRNGGFDRTDNDHLDAQKALNDACKAEAERRTDLLRTLADGADGDLDYLARAVTIYAIGELVIVPAASPCMLTGRHDAHCHSDDPKTVQAFNRVHRPNVAPNTPKQVLDLAEIVDDTIRTPIQLIDSDRLNEVFITETFYSPIRKKLLSSIRGGESKPEHKTGIITTRATFAQEDIWHNNCQILIGTEDDPASVRAKILPRLGISTSFDQSESPDKKPEKKSRLGLGRRKSEPSQIHMPLIAVMYALGDRNVTHYDDPALTPESSGYTMEISINGHTLPLEPRQISQD